MEITKTRARMCQHHTKALLDCFDRAQGSSHLCRKHGQAFRESEQYTQALIACDRTQVNAGFFLDALLTAEQSDAQLTRFLIWKISNQHCRHYHSVLHLMAEDDPVAPDILMTLAAYLYSVLDIGAPVHQLVGFDQPSRLTLKQCDQLQQTAKSYLAEMAVRA